MHEISCRDGKITVVCLKRLLFIACRYVIVSDKFSHGFGSRNWTKTEITLEGEVPDRLRRRGLIGEIDLRQNYARYKN